MPKKETKVIEIPRRSGRNSAEELLVRCGEKVPRSGIYEAIHASHGLESYEVVAVRGEMVKRCNDCGAEVHLRLIYAAPHVSEDSDFCPDRSDN
jgi:predicted secreted Zn-dependent protease